MSELLQPAAGETGRLSRSRRIVVKIGSSLLVADGQLKRDWLAALCDDLQMLAKAGAELIVVSSGAIALGRGVLGLAPGPLRLEQAQAAASVRKRLKSLEFRPTEDTDRPCTKQGEMTT